MPEFENFFFQRLTLRQYKLALKTTGFVPVRVRGVIRFSVVSHDYTKWCIVRRIPNCDCDSE